ncbi:MAG TPA: zinc ribbon domain-containing protein, partial [Thermoplasmata archaeon]
MNCTQCGAPLPDNARFCFSCGTPVLVPSGGVPPPPPPSGAPLPPAPPTGAASSASPTLAPIGAESLKCPSCGAPVHPVFGEMVISCDYCGGSVTLGGTGWKQINKHTLLAPKVTDRDSALRVVHDY